VKFRFRFSRWFLRLDLVRSTVQQLLLVVAVVAETSAMVAEAAVAVVADVALADLHHLAALVEANL